MVHRRGLLARIPKLRQQILDNPDLMPLLKRIGRGAMLPDRETDGLAGVLLQHRLRKESGDKTAEDIAAAALGQIRVPGRIDVNIAFGAAGECLMTL